MRHFVANEDQAGSIPVVRSIALAARRSCGGPVNRGRRFDSDRGLDHSSVAKRHCARLLTEEVQVRVLPLELCGRGRLARRQPSKLFQASSILVARSMRAQLSG